MTTQKCVALHRKATLATNGLLCQQHYKHLHNLISDIKECNTDLHLFYEPGTATDDGRQVRGKRVDPPAPVRLDIIALLDRRTNALHPGDPIPAARILEDWAALITEQRNLYNNPYANMTAHIETIQTHADWSTLQEWVTDLLDELTQVRNALRNAIGDNPPPSVGKCPITTDQETCNGKLYQDRYNGLSVFCSKCAEVWNETDLRRLGLMLGTN